MANDWRREFGIGGSLKWRMKWVKWCLSKLRVKWCLSKLCHSRPADKSIMAALPGLARVEFGFGLLRRQDSGLQPPKKAFPRAWRMIGAVNSGLEVL